MTQRFYVVFIFQKLDNMSLVKFIFLNFLTDFILYTQILMSPKSAHTSHSQLEILPNYCDSSFTLRNKSANFVFIYSTTYYYCCFKEHHLFCDQTKKCYPYKTYLSFHRLDLSKPRGHLRSSVF